MQIVKLSPQDLPLIKSLGHAVHTNTSDTVNYRKALMPTGLSMGIFCENRFAGYLLAYRKHSTLNHALGEKVILVEDAAVLRDKRHCLTTMLMFFGMELAEKNLLNLSIEFICLNSLHHKLLVYRNIVEIWGYELSCAYELSDRKTSLIRFEPVRQGKDRKVFGSRIWGNNLHIFDRKPKGPISCSDSAIAGRGENRSGIYIPN